jgi:hypothetical protein
MKKIIHLVLAGIISLSTQFPVSGQVEALQTINENDLKACVSFLASDLLQGRELGTTTPGLDIAAEFIKAAALKTGLKPAGNDYFQPVGMISVSRDPLNSYLQITGSQGKTLVKSDSVYTFGGSADLIMEGKLVFAGYGWQDSLKNYDDLAGLDVKDKLVLIMTRNPDLVKKGEVTGGTGRRSGLMSETGKITRIIQAGAKGVILVSDPLDTTGGMMSRIIEMGSRASFSLDGQQDARGGLRRPGNMFVITPSLANSILAQSGKKLTALQEQINKSGKPASFELSGISVKINLARIRKPVPAENIIGIVEGSDPVLKNECIVYMAHYDHLGVDPQGDVFNGADDNASGVAGLLEIAEAFTKLEKKPRRSIVFAWVTGEEIGLLGSLYYTQNPVIPMEKTVACINLDMIGRVKADDDTAQFVRGEKNLTGRNGVYVISGGRSTELDALNISISSGMGLISDGSMSQNYINRSDYAHFHRRGIPILGYSTGVHAEYHTVKDEISTLDFPKMKVVTQLAFRVGYAVADKPDRIVVDKPLESN